jgi:hypothetical protein
VVFVSHGAAIAHSATPAVARTVAYDGTPAVVHSAVR